ncbi:hypothetical protein K435DRAFT_688774, partial [Dendrothele bispora CBS 962.96]
AASPTATFCSGQVGTSDCVAIPVVSDECINFTGGLTILNKEISWAVIPDGFVCTLFAQFGCSTARSSNSQDEISLVGGTHDILNVPGIAGPTNFNDMPSSVSCSPV